MMDNCMNCEFAIPIKEITLIKVCTNRLSGCFKTDVTAYEKCERYKRASKDGAENG